MFSFFLSFLLFSFFFCIFSSFFLSFFIYLFIHSFIYFCIFFLLVFSFILFLSFIVFLSFFLSFFFSFVFSVFLLVFSFFLSFFLSFFQYFLSFFLNAVVWMVSIFPLISNSSRRFPKIFGTLPSVPKSIDITVILFSHCFFTSQARFHYLSVFPFSSTFTLLSASLLIIILFIIIFIGQEFKTRSLTVNLSSAISYFPVVADATPHNVELHTSMWKTIAS